MDEKYNKKSLFFYFKIVAFGVILYVALSNLKSLWSYLNIFLGIITPFLAGGFVAFILNIPLKLFEEKIFGKWKPKKIGFKRAICMLLTICILIAIMFLLGYIVAPRVQESIISVAQKLPEFEDQLVKLPVLKEYEENIHELFSKLNINSVQRTLINYVQNANSDLFNTIVSRVGSVLNTLFAMFMGFTFAIYALSSKEDLARKTKELLYSAFPERWADKFIRFGEIVFDNFYNFFTGQFIEALVFGSMCFVGMLIFGFPFAPAISIIMGLGALIPILGAYIGVFTGALLILLQSPFKALMFIIFVVVLQQFDGNVTYPRIVGNKVGLPAMFVIVAITVGGALFGIIGMILFVPLFSTIYTLLGIYKDKKLKEKGIDIKTK